MMLKERPPSTQPARPVHRHAKPNANEAAAAPSRSHTDYDRQPLRVNSLDHYVKVDSDNRFHVH